MSDTTPTGTPAAAHVYPPRRPKAAPFARYEGTSAWRKNRKRVRAYNLFKAATRAHAATPHS